LVMQLADAGFTNLTFSVGYLSHLIRAVFANGAGEHANISWVTEPEPLGTAAPLRLVQGLDSTFLVMNGDLLTTLDYGALLEQHRQSGNVLTIAVSRRRVQVDYGVLHVEGQSGVAPQVVAYEEKPEMAWDVSMGIYAVEPSALAGIPPEGPFDFPELVTGLLAAGQPVGAYRHDGLWLDIGRHDDYQHAVELWEHGAQLGGAAALQDQ